MWESREQAVRGLGSMLQQVNELPVETLTVEIHGEYLDKIHRSSVSIKQKTSFY